MAWLKKPLPGTPLKREVIGTNDMDITSGSDWTVFSHSWCNKSLLSFPPLLLNILLISYSQRKKKEWHIIAIALSWKQLSLATERHNIFSKNTSFVVQELAGLDSTNLRRCSLASNCYTIISLLSIRNKGTKQSYLNWYGTVK